MSGVEVYPKYTVERQRSQCFGFLQSNDLFSCEIAKWDADIVDLPFSKQRIGRRRILDHVDVDLGKGNLLAVPKVGIGFHLQ